LSRPKAPNAIGQPRNLADIVAVGQICIAENANRLFCTGI
jgi:hypothetical protein